MKKSLITKQYKLILVSSLYMLLVCNIPFFFELLKIYPLTPLNTIFIISLFIVVFLILISILALLASKKTTKFLICFFLIVASIANYFMYAFGVVLDHVMFQNLYETDVAEATGVLNWKLILNVAFIGVIPATIIWRSHVAYGTLKSELRSKAIVVLSSVLMAGLIFGAMSSHYIPFLREHKITRYYVNPLFPIFSGIRFINKTAFGKKRPLIPAAIATDAQVIHKDGDKEERRPDRELVVMVVGETARADRFQINGYVRETNPLLSKVSNLVSYSHVSSCGTSTAVSVPCMFSMFKNKDFKKDNIYTHENVLDILKKNGVNILWRDNNSSSKGVADRVAYESFKNSKDKTLCKDECRDENLLLGLDTYIEEHKEGDILIVLHQMGSHGPEFYKRYPEEHEFFKPSCKTAHLSDCTQEEINNAYDNTIRYTDHFLSKTIDLVKKYDSQFEASVFYISDHGESLGEKGIFLHGLPMVIAPEEQIHIPAFIWTGSNFDYPYHQILPFKDDVFTHENVPCTMLAMFEIYTDECKQVKSMMGPVN